MTPKTPRSPPSATRIVEILTFPSVQILDVAGPLQVFTSANEFMAKTEEMPPYVVRVVAQGGQSVKASAGVALATHPLPPVEAGLDTLVIAGGPGVEAASTDNILVDWVRERAGQARRTASVCTGAFLLAASGVLD